MSHLFRSLYVLLLGAAIIGCARPASYETFVRSDETVDGAYIFNIVLDDSLKTYDISFYTAEPVLEAICLDVTWTSPGSLLFSEKVYMQTESCVEQYRTGVSVHQPGEWTIVVRPSSLPDDFRGLGIICKNNGTR